MSPSSFGGIRAGESGPPAGPTGLEGKVAAEILLTGDAVGRWGVDEGVPRAVALPRTPDEAADVLGWAGELGLSVAAAGVGTRLAGSGLPRCPDLVVSTTAMSRVLHYEPADMTLAAQAGVTGARLAEITDAQGQTLPLNPRGWMESTLGGLFSRGEAGGSQLLYGRVRDLALGLTLVTGDGSVLRVGGQVVKNVAGFDLVRLGVGSQGSLGLVAEVSARLFPLPEREEVLWVGLAGDRELGECTRVVQQAPFPLAGAEARWSWGFGLTGAGMVLRLQGNREPVEEMATFLHQALAPHALRRLNEEERAAAVKEMESPLRAAGSGALPALVDLSGLPDDLPETLALARELDPSLRETAAFPMTGEVRVGIEGGSAAEERLRGVASALVERGGAVRVLHGPASLYRVARESLEDAGLGRLTAELRALFDPRKTLVWGSGGEG